MGSVSLMLAVLWDQSPLLMGALAGPLIAVALYQRSVHRAITAMRLALTDAQTGLGNKRHFEELLQRYLDKADETATPLTLCIVDLDNFKTINDTYGHLAGDRVLAQVAARLRRGGESFRIGGDEFALLLPGRTTGGGPRGRRDRLAPDRGGARTSTAATSRSRSASRPTRATGVERTELVRVADKALYAAKGHGKARVHVYTTGEDVAAAPERLSRTLGRVADLRHERALAASPPRGTSTWARTRTTSAISRRGSPRGSSSTRRRSS